MKFLKLVLITVPFFSSTAYSALECFKRTDIKVFLQNASGKFVESKSKCVKIVENNMIILHETVFVGLEANTPFYYTKSVQDTPQSDVETFQCGSDKDLKTLSGLAGAVINKTIAKIPSFKVEESEDFMVFEKISKNQDTSEHVPNNYPIKIMDIFALGPNYPMDYMDLDPSCKKIK